MNLLVLRMDSVLAVSGPDFVAVVDLRRLGLDTNYFPLFISYRRLHYYEAGTTIGEITAREGSDAEYHQFRLRYSRPKYWEVLVDGVVGKTESVEFWVGPEHLSPPRLVRVDQEILIQPGPFVPPVRPTIIGAVYERGEPGLNNHKLIHLVVPDACLDSKLLLPKSGESAKITLVSNGHSRWVETASGARVQTDFLVCDQETFDRAWTLAAKQAAQIRPETRGSSS